MRYFAGASFIFVICLGVLAQAQYPVPYYYGGGAGYHHASTVEEGAARGMADVIRSRGAANLMNSEAAKNFEDARRRRIENRLQWTNTYFEMRRVNRDARREMRGPPPTQEQLIRVAKSKLPDRLKATRLDPLTGGIQWPTLLKATTFKEDRERLEKLYAQRAQDGLFGPDEYLQVRALTSKMLNELQRIAKSFPGNYSIEARKFLDSLAFEAQFQAG